MVIKRICYFMFIVMLCYVIGLVIYVSFRHVAVSNLYTLLLHAQTDEVLKCSPVTYYYIYTFVVTLYGTIYM